MTYRARTLFQKSSLLLSNAAYNSASAGIIVCSIKFRTDPKLQDQVDCIYTLIFMLRFIDSSQKEKDSSETSSVKLT